MSDEIGMPPAARPSGWYPSPNSPGYGEYWNGAHWTGVVRADTVSVPDPAPVLVAAPSAGRTLGLSTWIGIVLIGLWVFIALVTSGMTGALIAAGMAGLFTALYVLISGRRSWLLIPSRKAGALLLAGALVATFTGSVIAPRPPQTDVVHLADSSQTEQPTPSPTPTPTVKKPVVTTKDVAEVQEIPFEQTTVDDGSLPSGTTTVTTTGVPGQRTITYTVTYTDGVETGRAVASDVTTVAPVAQVTANGTYVAPVVRAPVAAAPSGGCDPNYDGACVPIASDVDCAGGSGDGPAYVAGPVRVIGSDIYDLDRDGDGIACD